MSLLHRTRGIVRPIRDRSSEKLRPRISSQCLINKHKECYKLNCSCICHKEDKDGTN